MNYNYDVFCSLIPEEFETVLKSFSTATTFDDYDTIVNTSFANFFSFYTPSVISSTIAADLEKFIFQYFDVSAFRHFDITISRKEQIADENGSDNASQVCQQSTAHSMTGVFDTHTAEIDGEDVERGVGRALEDTAQTPYKRVGTIGSHGIHHHTTGTTTT